MVFLNIMLMTKTDPDNEDVIGKNFIDLDKVIKEKNPRLYRRLPRFVISYLKKIAHQEAINQFLYKHREKQGIAFVEAMLNEFGVIVETSGSLLIPDDRQLILVANHPLGGIDGLALISVAAKAGLDIVFPVNDLLMNVPNVRSLFIPVNKHGRNARLVRELDESFSSPKTILYFPAGLCSRKVDGRIVDLEWKKTFVVKARTFKRDIIPVHIEARNSSFFYNLARIRKIFGIKTNIEMMFLVDEMMKQKNKTIRFTFGKPIPWNVFDSRFTDRQWASSLRDFVYTLPKNPNQTFNV